MGQHISRRKNARRRPRIHCHAVELWLTADEHRAANGFTWEPIKEVAKLFAGIFVAIIPVLAMLGAGKDGAFAWLLSAVSAPDGAPHEVAYFWVTGILSAMLDNAPTYLVFFQLAGGNARELMGPLAGTLASISMGAVYMGALTYIGNAPNFMVNAIATERGVRNILFSSCALYVILSPIVFYCPLRPFRRAMIRSKRELMLPLANQMQVELARVAKKAKANPPYQGDGDKLAVMQKIGEQIDEIPTWPFNIVTLRKYALALLTPSFQRVSSSHSTVLVWSHQSRLCGCPAPIGKLTDTVL